MNPTLRNARLTLPPLIGGLLVCAALIGGCRRESAMPDTYVVPPPRAADVVVDTPENAARSTLLLLRQHLEAVQAGDKAAAIRHRDQVVWHLAAQDNIIASHHRSNPKAGGERVEILNTLVENWAAIIAHYADGLALDRIQRDVATDRGATLHVPAHAPDGDATLVVLCVRSDADEWRVLRLEFLPPPAPREPAPQTQPATNGQTPPP